MQFNPAENVMTLTSTSDVELVAASQPTPFVRVKPEKVALDGVSAS